MYYKHKYITKDIPRSSSPALDRGIKVHAMLEDAVKSKQYPQGVWTPDWLLRWLWSKENVVRAEMPLALDRDLNRVDFWDKNAFVRGKADVVVQNSTGVFVVDWKTGQVRIDPLQAEMTHLLLTRGLGVKVSFMWVFVDQEVDEAVELTQEASVTACRAVAEVEAAEEYLPSVNWGCKWCELKEGCDAK